MEEERTYLDILAATLQKQLEALSEVHELTLEQRRLAEQPVFDERMLEDTMERKDILIGRLNELDEGFASVYDRARGQVSRQKDQYPEEMARLQELVRQCTDLSVEIKVQEERNRTLFARRFAEKHREYSSQRTAASVATRYYQTMRGGQSAEAYFFNKKN